MISCCGKAEENGRAENEREEEKKGEEERERKEGDRKEEKRRERQLSSGAGAGRVVHFTKCLPFLSLFPIPLARSIPFDVHRPDVF